MPLTKQQQAVIDGLEQEEQVEAAFNAFIAERGDEVGPYLCGATAYATAKKMGEWGLINLGREPMATVSGIEIAFNNTKAFLVADPDWQPLKKVFGDFEASITAAQWKQIYAGEVPGNLRADQRAALDRIGGVEGFKKSIDGGKQ